MALTLTPVLCSYLLGNNKSKGLPKEAFVAVWMKKHYRNALLWSLNHKSAVLGFTGGLFAVALVMFFTLGRSFFGRIGQNGTPCGRVADVYSRNTDCSP